MGDTYDSESCPICLRVFTSQMIGVLNTCKHQFCLECIMRSSKEENICPCDRQVFKVIQAVHNGETVAEFKVQASKKRKKVAERYDFTSVCEVCRNERYSGRLLLCDACDLAYHLKCLDPPLTHVPPGEWYCPVCASVFSRSLKKGKKPSCKKEDLKTKEEALQERQAVNKWKEANSGKTTAGQNIGNSCSGVLPSVTSRSRAPEPTAASSSSSSPSSSQSSPELGGSCRSDPLSSDSVDHPSFKLAASFEELKKNTYISPDGVLVFDNTKSTSEVNTYSDYTESTSDLDEDDDEDEDRISRSSNSHNALRQSINAKRLSNPTEMPVYNFSVTNFIIENDGTLVYVN